jgi:hypothetical protein
MNNLRPCVLAALEPYDYPIRAEVLRIIRCGAVDSAHPRLREVVEALSAMAYAGLVEFFGGWDHESAHWALEREHSLATDLADIEATLIENDGSTTLKAEIKVEMAQREAEIRAAMEIDRQPRRPKLPAGSRPDMTTYRAVAVWREREAAAEE